MSNQSRKKLKQNSERISNLDDCIDAQYNYKLLVSQSNSNKNYNNFKSPTQED